MTAPTWHNAFGEPVDLDNIDREYALNILCHYTLNAGWRGLDHEDMHNDPLVQKLRGIVLNGRKPNFWDRQRAVVYNIRCALRGLPWRA